MMNPLTCVLALMLFQGTLAQTEEKTPEPWANKLFGDPSNLHHDFGTVPHNSFVTYAFEVTNIYQKPIEISSIRSSMSAHTVNAIKTQLQPNEKTKIVVTIDTHRFNGMKTSAIYVTFAPNHSEVRLMWTANSK